MTAVVPVAAEPAVTMEAVQSLVFELAFQLGQLQARVVALELGTVIAGARVRN